MSRIAIITGATGGIGTKFAKAIAIMDDVEEVWAVGRNKEKLNKLAKNNSKIVTIEADLSTDGIEILSKKIAEEKPDIRMLVNNAGVAYMGLYEKMETDEVERFCKLNCSVPSELISETLPYMHEGAKILNVSSASSFQPNPYLAMYSSTKVYLKNLSRSLNVELKPRGITVTAVCPYWVDTDMLPKEHNGKKIRYTGMISADKVVRKALKDSARGKDMSVPGFFANYFRLYAKVTPTSIIMRQWAHSVKKFV